ncbi:MAG: response regulator [Candidatus Omnitrophica bacterium]|nr:response regulator [Candidatus Omnitrophota bacterium]
MTKPLILVVDDEADVAEILKIRLERQGFEVVTAARGAEAIRKARRHLPGLVLLDLMLPDMDGLEVCKALKSDPSSRHIPVIMLTAKSSSTDEVAGLELGADDYITKPFDFGVLFARIRKLTSASQPAVPAADPTRVLKAGKLVLDEDRQKVFVGGQEAVLTTLEFRILGFFMKHPGRVYSRDALLSGAWGDHVTVVDRAVDVHINGIRKKLGKAADYIETVRGSGYRFKELD